MSHRLEKQPSNGERRANGRRMKEKSGSGVEAVKMKINHLETNYQSPMRTKVAKWRENRPPEERTFSGGPNKSKIITSVIEKINKVDTGRLSHLVR
jgi:hypothetical protein